ncbi:MAG: hypothetical protein IIC67_09100 [Thaumarchaeota archaeon]|nr:hypothetical protein [Nitrososphaerota archaeon]
MALKGNRNRRSGFAYEHRFCIKLKKQGMKRVKRHYGSLGAADVEWTGKDGVRNHAQLKYSRIRLPKVDKKTMSALKKYAEYQGKRGVKVWLICKMSHGEEKWLEIK